MYSTDCPGIVPYTCFCKPMHLASEEWHTTQYDKASACWLRLVLSYILHKKCVWNLANRSAQVSVHLRSIAQLSSFLRVQYTVRPKKKKSHTLIFPWTTFSFDYGLHLRWHHFDKLMQCFLAFSYFRQDLVLIMGELARCVTSSPAHPKDSQWSGHCGGQSIGLFTQRFCIIAATKACLLRCLCLFTLNQAAPD